MKRRVTYVIEYLLDDFNNAMIEAKPSNAYRQMTNASKPQANPSCGRTHPVFVEVLRGRQELLQQGDRDNDNSDDLMEKFMLAEN